MALQDLFAKGEKQDAVFQDKCIEGCDPPPPLALLQIDSLHRQKEKAKCFEFSFPGNEMALLCVHCVVDWNKTGPMGETIEQDDLPHNVHVA